MVSHTFLDSMEAIVAAIEVICPWSPVRGPPPILENRGVIDETIDRSINTSQAQKDSKALRSNAKMITILYPDSVRLGCR